MEMRRRQEERRLLLGEKKSKEETGRREKREEREREKSETRCLYNGHADDADDDSTFYKRCKVGKHLFILEIISSKRAGNFIVLTLKRRMNGLQGEEKHSLGQWHSTARSSLHWLSVFRSLALFLYVRRGTMLSITNTGCDNKGRASPDLRPGEPTMDRGERERERVACACAAAAATRFYSSLSRAL